MSMTQTLRQAIIGWTEEKDKRSLTMLARRSKVSYSTVRRIVNGETEVSPANAIKLADAVMGDVEFRNFTEEFLPALARTRSEVAYKAGDGDLVELLSDPAYIPIILLASHVEGTNRDEVRDLYGQKAVARFQDLIDAGHLSRGEHGSWCLKKDLGTVDLDAARCILSVMANICPETNDDISRSSLAHAGWESVNFETALAIYHAALDFVRTAVKLTKDKSNRGDILVIYGSLFNVIKGVEAYK